MEKIEDTTQIVKEYISNNFENIVKLSPNDKMGYLIGLAKKLENGEELLNKNKDLIILKLMAGWVKLETIEEEGLADYFKIAMNEIMEEEGKEIGDIEEYGKRGSRAKVYRVGNKIIKTGIERVQERLPYHRRILKPLLKTRLYKKDWKTPLLYLEIAELADIEDISEDEVYAVYKELRDEGLIWIDARTSNLGRLIRPNVAHFKGISSVSYSTMGFDEEVIEDDPLKAGELVIIDLDQVYREKEYMKSLEIDKTERKVFLESIYERRYQRERILKMIEELEEERERVV